MKLSDIVSGPWAITPTMLDEIQAIYAAHTRGPKIDLKAVEASLGRPLANEQKPYQVDNGTAVIPVMGVISKRMNLFSQISGGASSQLIQRDFQAALADPEVQRVMLYIDSPGGSVDGIFELSDAVYQARGTKPVTAFTDGQMCSAAYLLGSAADTRYISSEATQVGSIGVICKHTDASMAEAAKGIKTTVLTAGKYKGTGHNHAPLSAEHEQTMQAELDYTYGAFVDTVARNLGVSSDRVVNDMAEGRVFLGTQAIAAGLVDGVSTMDALLQQDGNPHQIPNQTNAVAGAPAANEESFMDLAELKLTHPGIYQAAVSEGTAAGMIAGAETERGRIQAIHALPVAAHKELVTAAMFDGKSTAGDVAMAMITKEAAVRTGALADMIADAPQPAAAAEPGDDAGDATKQAAMVASMVATAAAAGRA